MRRSFRALAALALLGAVGCQDYNFNPVGQCYLQPGTMRVRLDDVSTADILFVVDDSGSMKDEQDNLAGGFSVFIDNLNAENAARVTRGLDPIDFHIAITSTAVYINRDSGATCRATCGTGTNVCCVDAISTPLVKDRTCAGPGAACGTGYTCRDDCTQAPGVYTCCSATGAPEPTAVTCTADQVAAAAACGDLDVRYPSACATWGAGSPYALFPQGNFLRAAGSSNPRVLHFDKNLYVPDGTTPPYTEAQLSAFFQQNVGVGICGSGQEQGFEAAKRAIEKHLAGAQPGVSRAEWLHAESKLVVVFVGDEDDCSSPEDAVDGIILSGAPGADSCTLDPSGKRFDMARYADFLTGLGRPLGAAFVVGTSNATCEDVVDTSPNACWPNPPNACAPAMGVRMLELARELRDRGADVVAASICAPAPEYFGPVLSRIADIVKPPEVLVLPTMPASDQLTVLRIVDKAGLTSKTCVGPADPGLTAGQAAATGCGGGPCDWWFVGSSSKTDPRDSLQLSRFVYINPDSTYCQANPGETYSADYLGRLPESGCTGVSDCVSALGGDPTDWQCCTIGASESCQAPGIGEVGTCVCGG